MGILDDVKAWTLSAIAFVLAMLFGWLRYMQDFRKPREEWPHFSTVGFIVQGLTAGAAGMLTMWLIAEWGIPRYLSAVMIAVAGWGGAEIISSLLEGVKDVLRRRLDVSGTPEKAAHNGTES